MGDAVPAVPGEETAKHHGLLRNHQMQKLVRDGKLPASPISPEKAEVKKRRQKAQQKDAMAGRRNFQGAQEDSCDPLPFCGSLAFRHEWGCILA